MITENTSAVKNPSISKPGTILEAIKTIRALITKVNSPNVITVIGREKKERIGFTIKFNAAKTKATIKETLKDSTVTPESKYAVA